MAKRRTSVRKREREIEKRQREIKKTQKAAEKRERRLTRDPDDPSGPSEGANGVVDQDGIAPSERKDSTEPDDAAEDAPSRASTGT